ncbi:MAG: lytic transglycosylase domain-containing protein [Bdellovibrionales bacterium]|nr:lytic transglycosylase domain-containing protein [Bdellovibrionales bacterium]
MLEAQVELKSLPIPSNPVNLYYFSILLSKAYQHPLSVRIMNQLLEATHDIRNLEMLKSIYPLTYSNRIKVEAKKYGIDSVLIMSLIRQESAFGLKALSTSQAAGLMQMIQPTAMEVAERLKLKIQFPEDLYRPEVNIPMGTFYYSDILKDFNGHVPLALASYNAGPHKIKTFLSLRDETKNLAQKASFDWQDDLWVDELPWAETTGYVKSILRNTLIYELIEGKKLSSKPDFWRDFVVIN